MKRYMKTIAGVVLGVSVCGLSWGAVVVHYNFDESVGASTLNDSAGSANGTASSVSFVTSGVALGTFGNAGSFNGTDSYVQFGSGSHPAGFDLGTGDFSFSGWFRCDLNEENINRPLFYCGNTSHVDNPGWFFRVGRADRTYRGQLLFTVEGTSVDTNVRVDDGQWHFVSVVSSGGTLTMYLDGTNAVDSIALSGDATASSTLEAYFGASSNGFEGELDNWRICDSALSTAEINDLWQEGLEGLALTAYYKFDESNGASILNDSAGSADGMVSGAGFVTSSVPSETFGNAGSFNGTNSYVQFGSGSHPAGFDLSTNDFSIAGWFKSDLNETNINRTLFYCGDAGQVNNSGWFFRIGRADRTYKGTVFFTIEGESVFSDVRVDDGEWHFVSVVRSNGTTTMYLDGANAVASAGTLTGSASAAFTDDAYFGSTANGFDGELDEWRVYNGAIDTTMIDALWQEGQATVIGRIEIVGIAPVSDEVLELTVSSDSPSLCWPKSMTALADGVWTNTPHSINGAAPFIVTNLDYSAASGTNFAIYVEIDSTQKFFKIGGEQD